MKLNKREFVFTKLLLPMAAFLFSGSFFAQDPDVKWGKEMRIDRSERYMEIIGSDSAFFYVFKDIKGSDQFFKLERYHKRNMKLDEDVEVEMPRVNGELTALEELIFLNDKFYLFTSFENEDAEQKTAFVTELDYSGNPLTQVREIDRFMMARKRNPVDVDVQLSADSSYFLVYHNRPFSKQSDEVFSFKVYDTGFQLIHEKQLSLPYNEQIYEVSKYLFDGRSNIYMLSGLAPEKNENRINRVGPENKRYVLLNYDFEANSLKEYDVSVKDKWINAVTFGITPAGDLAIGGFYSNDFHFSIAGTFYFLLDGRSKEIKAHGMMAFSKEFLRKFESGRRTATGRELDDYYFDHFILRENGEAILVAEQYYMSEMVQTDPATGYQTVNYNYNFNDILVVKINSDGTIAWTRKVPKYQVTSNDNGPYSSYALASNEDRIYFVFNDHPDNYERLAENPDAGLRSFGNVRKSVASLVTIDDDNGEMKRVKLFNAKEVDTVLKPKISFQSAPDEIIIYGRLRRNYKFGRIHFQ